jgi:hypothetical protein
MWLYNESSDLTRKSVGELAELEVRAWIKHVLEESASVDLGNRLTPLH